MAQDPNRIEKSVDTPEGPVVFLIEEATPQRRVTPQLVERLRQIGASPELLAFAERSAREDARLKDRRD